MCQCKTVCCLGAAHRVRLCNLLPRQPSSNVGQQLDVAAVQATSATLGRGVVCTLGQPQKKKQAESCKAWKVNVDDSKTGARPRTSIWGARDVGSQRNLKKPWRSYEQVRWNADRENFGEEKKTQNKKGKKKTSPCFGGA